MRKSVLIYKSLPGFLLGVMLLTLGWNDDASAQRRVQGTSSSGILEAGTTINVRTTEPIQANESDGRVFMGVVDQDVTDRTGRVLIPRGSDVELVVRNVSDDEVAIDLDSIQVNGGRYGVSAAGNSVTVEDKDGIGANKRTGKYVGGGAILGAIIGGIAGGGKGAAIGAGAGAAAGAGAQVLTRGRSLNIPTESLLTFRLQQPLRTPVADTGFERNGNHYHSAEASTSTSTPAYRAGLQAGRSDRDRNLPLNMRTDRWTGQDRRDYEAGYERGYSGDTVRQRPADTYDRSSARASVRILRDNNVTWEAPEIVRVYVQVDNKPRQLFAEGQSGTQLAPWISRGHIYNFIVMDVNGNELARDRLDLR